MIIVSVAVLSACLVIFVLLCSKCTNNDDPPDNQEADEPCVAIVPEMVDNNVVYSQTTGDLNLLPPSEYPANGPVIISPATEGILPPAFPTDDFPSVTGKVHESMLSTTN